MKFLIVDGTGDRRIVEADSFVEAVESVTWKYESSLVSITRMPDEEE